MIDRRSLIVASAALALWRPLPVRAADELTMEELYTPEMGFSRLAEELDGQRVTVKGYMAPPLKADSRFYVLSKVPLAVCPFCDVESQWPADILAVYAKRVVTVIPYTVAIATTGTLSLGTYTDPETGFLSRVRLEDASFTRA